MYPEFWQKLIASSAPAIFFLGLIVVISVHPASRRMVQRLVEQLFVIAKEERETPRLADEVAALKEQVEELRAGTQVSSTNPADVSGYLESATISLRIQEAVDKKLRGLSESGDAVVRHLEAQVREAVIAELSQRPLPELTTAQTQLSSQSNRAANAKEFGVLLARQLASANNTRAVMMNLFVLFNVALLLLFVLTPERFTDKSSLTVLGVYVSLSAFIIYIYRASNARSASLLAIKEDEKKLSSVFDFLETFKKSGAFTNNEVDLIRLILVNRVEREKGADHPYEVILKGVTNSTVLLKGGKVSSSAAKAE